MKLGILEPLNQLSRKIGIDLGTSRIRIWSDQGDVIVDEPACIALDTTVNKVLAVGVEAQAMLGRLGENVQVIYPLVAGAVRDQAISEAMLKVLLQKVMRTVLFFRPVVMVSIPSLLTEPEKIALTETLFNLGFREVNFIDQVLAAAIGAGVPIADASGTLLLHLGAGVTEAAIISLSSLVAVESSLEAGLRIDREIRRHIRQVHFLDIGRATAERLKKEVGTLLANEQREQRVTGQNLLDSSPKEVIVTSDDLLPVLRPFCDTTLATVKQLFRHIPPELATDIIDKGILLTGGLANLRGLDSLLVAELGIPVSLVDEPDQVVIKGVGQVLQNLDVFRESTGYRYSALQNG
jgi:rod shape-determining protein MreB